MLTQVPAVKPLLLLLPPPPPPTTTQSRMTVPSLIDTPIASSPLIEEPGCESTCFCTLMEEANGLDRTNATPLEV